MPAARPRTRDRLRPPAALAAAAALAACRPDVEVVRTVPSPDGALVARYYVLSGGGAAGYVHELVGVQPRGERFAPSARRAALGMAHGGDVTLTWAGPRRLVVTYPAWASVFRRCPAAGGAQVAYVTRAEPDSAWDSAARAEHGQHWRERTRPDAQPPVGCG